MSEKCGKRCFERGCQSPRLHVGPGAKFCPPCSKLVSAGRTAGEMCLRCQYLYYEWATRVIGSNRTGAGGEQDSPKAIV
jgi:hypothetical protein